MTVEWAKCWHPGHRVWIHTAWLSDRLYWELATEQEHLTTEQVQEAELLLRSHKEGLTG